MINNAPKYNIICLSNQIWDFPNWTNKHHVMSRLSQDYGYKVLFVDPPINTGRLFFRQLCRGAWNLKRLLTGKKIVNSNMTVFSPLDVLPLKNITSNVHVSEINKYADKYFDKNAKTILWVYHVEIASIQTYLDKMHYDVLVYDCVDNYEAFPKYDTQEKKQFVRNQEALLAKRANIVFASAPGLMEKLKKYNKKVYFTPNVGDYEKFSSVSLLKDNEPDDIKYLQHPIVGFTGSLDEYKFDKNLMRELADTLPNVTFVLIGQIALQDREASLKEVGLDKCKNICFLGTKKYEIIQNYFAGFDAFIIPYQLNEYTVGGCFPVKFHDALAAGLSTIVTDLPAYAPFKDVCYISKNYGEFIANVKRALDENSPVLQKARKLVAKQNNWDGKVASMLQLINSL